MKVLVVDDEALARERLARLVGEIEDCELCGSAANGREALAEVERQAPDVVLMDIRMPGMDGLEAARHLACLEQPPAVIFTTAYGEHALDAFESRAVDYLLKPVRRERLARALAGARRLTRPQLDSLRQEGQAVPRSHICARSRGRMTLVPVEDIRAFHAEHKYVAVLYGQGEVLIEESLKALEAEFGPRFLRVHRSTLVAPLHVEALARDGAGRWQVRLRGIDRRLEVSRRHLAAVRKALTAPA